MRMVKHQQRLQRALGCGAMAVPGMMNRTFGSAGMFGPRGMFGPSGMFGHRGMFGHHGMLGHRGPFGAGSRGFWRRRSRRLFPVLLGLLLVGIATAVMSARGQRPGPGNWVSV